MIDYEQIKTQENTKDYEPVEIETQASFNPHFRYYLWYKKIKGDNYLETPILNLSYPVLFNLDYSTDFIVGERKEDILTEFLIEI